MNLNPLNILKLSDRKYDAKEPHKNHRIDVIYALFKRHEPRAAANRDGLLHRHLRLLGMQGLRGRVQAMEHAEDHGYPVVEEQL